MPPRRAAKKAAPGARFLQLQLCYRTEQLERCAGPEVRVADVATLWNEAARDA